MLRFSLASLLGLVLFAAVGSAALANPTEVWRQATVSVTVTILLTATLAALVRRGRSQTYSLGFAVFGWIYLLLVFASVLGLRDDLLTHKALTYLFSKIHREHSVVDVEFSRDGRFLVTGSAQGTVRLWDLTAEDPTNSPVEKVRFRDFADIGHSMWLIIVACSGGILAQLLCQEDKPSDQSSNLHGVRAPFNHPFYDTDSTHRNPHTFRENHAIAEYNG